MNCPDCGIQMTAVEYRGTPEDYDGVSEFVCQRDGVRIGRWTGKRLAEGEIEPRYGEQRPKDAA